MKQKSILQSKMSLEATPPPPHDFEVDGIYYKYNGDGTVSVTYKGLSFSQYDGEYTGKVVIPPSITIFVVVDAIDFEVDGGGGGCLERHL